jgi:hypothetical protein
LPKVDKHLGELGVDLAAVTFGWWLSLFCDCLPVEVCLWVSRDVVAIRCVNDWVDGERR